MSGVAPWALSPVFYLATRTAHPVELRRRIIFRNTPTVGRILIRANQLQEEIERQALLREAIAEFQSL